MGTHRRLTVISAARREFEQGWAATTKRDVAEAVGVSQKLVEAQFGTQATLLQATDRKRPGEARESTHGSDRGLLRAPATVA